MNMSWLRLVVPTTACVALALACPHAQGRDPAVTALVASQQFKQAGTFIRADHGRFVQELIALTEIPAPPFKEERRGLAYLEMLRALGLSDVERDPEGNVMGVRKGTGGGPMLAV